MVEDEQVVYTDPNGKVWHPHRGYWCWKVSSELAQAQERIRELEAKLADRVKVKQLEWSEVRQPDEEIRYHHVIAESPIGSWSIEWKGWKDYDDRTVFLNGDFVDNGGDDLDRAKAAAQADYERRILSALEATPSAPKVTDEFKQYRRKQIAELRPWQPGECMDGVSVSAEDLKAGSPKAGDMIARNPKNHDDQWLVAAAYFADNFEPLLALTAAQEAAPKVTECATEGCEQTATVRFERGGVGSDYCHGCYMRIQTLTAAQESDQ